MLSVETLIKKSIDACEYAYCPYSNFPVGACVFTDKGYFTGVNVENAAYGSTICAERTAITKAVSEGSKEFKAIAIVCRNLDGFSRPCGSCRQVIVEFGDFPCYMVHLKKDGSYAYEEAYSMSLLPGAFTKDELQKAAKG
eukprot:GHVR01001616.1.p1 GENE.GHVR01001616.1~~GHVR01001616.1.p1  ORF type:complete len:140 (+),score=20.76 GHVR01001616.1:32-451(+)